MEQNSILIEKAQAGEKEAPQYAEQLVKEFRRLLESHEHKETTAKDHDPE